MYMHGLGEGAQVQADDRSFEPDARCGDDFIRSCTFCRHYFFRTVISACTCSATPKPKWVR